MEILLLYEMRIPLCRGLSSLVPYLAYVVILCKKIICLCRTKLYYAVLKFETYFAKLKEQRYIIFAPLFLIHSETNLFHEAWNNWKLIFNSVSLKICTNQQNMKKEGIRRITWTLINDGLRIHNSVTENCIEQFE